MPLSTVTTHEGKGKRYYPYTMKATISSLFGPPKNQGCELYDGSSTTPVGDFVCLWLAYQHLCEAPCCTNTRNSITNVCCVIGMQYVSVV